MLVETAFGRFFVLNYIVSTRVFAGKYSLDSESFLTARKWFKESNKIGFLGFGFDPLNVHRLGLIDVLNYRRIATPGHVPEITASVLNKANAEINRIIAKLCPGFGFGHFDMNNTMTVRTSTLLG